MMTKTLFACATIAAALSLACGSAQARTLTIGLDISKSAPLLVSDSYAAGAAQYADDAISALSIGDKLTVQYVGARTLGNLRTLDITISKRNRAAQVGDAIAALIRGIPGNPSIEGQNWTNLTRFLAISELGCADGGAALLISDGIESSQQTNERELMAGRSALPAPDGQGLTGCTITIYGLGASASGAFSPAQIGALKAAWEHWAELAGAQLKAVEIQ